jgi:hypothetical protein
MFGLLGKVANPIGSMLTGFSDSKAKERASKLEMEVAREEMRQGGENRYIDALLRREQERRAGRESAWKQLQQAEFLGNGGTKSPMLSPYSKQVQGPSENMRLAATNETFIDELVKRAHGADPLNYTNAGHTDMQLRRLAMPGSESPANVYFQMDRLMKPGLLEKIAGYAGAGLSAISGSGRGSGDSQQ